MVVKIGIIKSGNIGASPVLELLLDERADRPNIDVRVFTSGAKMNPEQVEDVVPKVKDFDPDFCIFTSPNPTAPGPAKARELLSAMDVPAFIIGDAPGKRAKDEMDEQGIGYIIVEADPMIGARRAIVAITCGTQVNLFEAQECVNLLIDAAGNNIDIKFGITINDQLTDEILVSVIASDFENDVDFTAQTMSAPIKTNETEDRQVEELSENAKREQERYLEEDSIIPNFLKDTK